MIKPKPSITNHPSVNWQDMALHNGAILIFSIKANSELRLHEVYNDYQSTDVQMDWFKHPLFNEWMKNRPIFDKLILELWSKQNPVVRLKFNAVGKLKSDWFNKSLLESSYPWSTTEMISQGQFLTTE